MKKESIRIATADDLGAVQSCANQAYNHYIERIGKAPAPMIADFAASIAAADLYVCEQEAEVVGFVVFYAKGDRMHLENVALLPGCQGQGLGARMIAFVEIRARELGFSRVELYTNAKMIENLGIYPRLGYLQFDRRVEDGFDRVYFKKIL
ncbi:MAG: ribosomal protein S18 acetylase RimI-like enzyme [Planctomycetota bacterium]|jgi:ribosomal protein S18 acetylase RimI-like enzyme